MMMMMKDLCLTFFWSHLFVLSLWHSIPLYRVSYPLASRSTGESLLLHTGIKPVWLRIWTFAEVSYLILDFNVQTFFTIYFHVFFIQIRYCKMHDKHPSTLEYACRMLHHKSLIIGFFSLQVNHMLYCFLISPQCELFNTVVSPTDAASLSEQLLRIFFNVGSRKMRGLHQNEH